MEIFKIFLEKIEEEFVRLAPVIGLCIPFFFVIFLIVVLSKSNSRRKSDYVVSTKDRLPYFKGMWGETEIANRLASLPYHYRVINDVMLENRNHTAQIDHIVVSPFGIFVIETKNYSGMIAGAELDDYVMHVCGDNQYTVYNPLKQNRAHVRALMRNLGVTDKELFIPVLTISDNCFCEIGSTTPIVPFSDICLAIRSYKRRVLSDRDVKAIAEKIAELNIVNEDARRNHIERVRLYNECPF